MRKKEKNREGEGERNKLKQVLPVAEAQSRKQTIKRIDAVSLTDIKTIQGLYGGK